MSKVSQRRPRRFKRSTRQLLRNVAIAVLTFLVIVTALATVSSYVLSSVRINMALTDDIIVSVYLTVALLIYQFVSWLLPRRR